MADPIHLVIEQGPDTGQRLTVPAEGLRLGRAPKNDVVLNDPLLSRHHCRFFFKPDGGLWVTDLGSANQTLVDDKPVTDAAVHVGERITIGNTVLKVIDDGRGHAETAPAAAAQPREEVDLGLPSSRKPAMMERGRKGPWILLGILVIALVVAAVLVILPKPGAKPPLQPSQGPASTALEVDYECVVAKSNSIFRYRLLITRDRTISIEIDDTATTHVRKDGQVKEDLIRDLADFIASSGFMALDEEYTGVQTDAVEQREISVTINSQAHRTRVLNRVPPADFVKLYKKLEDFGHVQLGMYAVRQFPAEKLREMAHDAFLLGRQFYEQREVAYGNLASAISSFTEAEFDLESVEPKPDFYAEILAGKRDCQEELGKRFDNQNFLAERAINLKDWETAARELRVILEMIPDRSDSRNDEARRKLLEVESRLKKIR